MAATKTKPTTATSPAAAPEHKAAAKKAPAKKAPAKKVGVKKSPAAKTPVAAAPAATPPAPAPKVKHKLVRDSFTIPKSEYLVLQALKERAADLKRPVKKSELLRAGIAALQGLTDKAFLAALGAVPSLKTGRPKGDAAGS